MGSEIDNNLASLQERLKIKFNNKELLRIALTHSSFSNENNGENNERLEFLGDAILDLCVADYLYRFDSKTKEGIMTKKRAQIVCEASLVHYAHKIDLKRFIFVGNGEEHDIKASIIADAFEALIGAIYLDFGYEYTKKFVINELVIPYMDETIEKTKDNKSLLQELVQADKKILSYQKISETGPSHDKEFTYIVVMDGIVLGQGKGKSKKAAEQNAAAMALEKLV